MTEDHRSICTGRAGRPARTNGRRCSVARSPTDHPHGRRHCAVDLLSSAFSRTLVLRSTQHQQPGGQEAARALRFPLRRLWASQFARSWTVRVGLPSGGSGSTNGPVDSCFQWDRSRKVAANDLICSFGKRVLRLKNRRERLWSAWDNSTTPPPR